MKNYNLTVFIVEMTNLLSLFIFYLLSCHFNNVFLIFIALFFQRSLSWTNEENNKKGENKNE